MIAAQTPEKLKDVCLNLSKKGANGALLSGGSDKQGTVRFDEFINVISEIKSETSLQLNLHTGLITNSDIIRRVAQAGVDAFSMDIVGESNTISEIYGLEKTPQDYENSLKIIFETGISNVVPHICIGLHYGEIKGEFNAINIIQNLKDEHGYVPNKLIFIVLIPTRGTIMQDVKVPEIDNIVEVITTARTVFPELELNLGCMRPKTTNKHRLIEIAAIKAGINGIVLPSNETIEYAKSHGYRVQKSETCCAVNR
jgi:uncharacterized radical SAM superfamily protein